MASKITTELNAFLGEGQGKINDMQVLQRLVGEEYAGKAEGEVMNFFSQSAGAEPEVLARAIKNAAVEVTRVFTHSGTFKNPLMDVFSKGDNPMGGKAQSIALDVANTQSYADVYGSNPYEYMKIDAFSQYYTYKLDRFAGGTVTGTQDNMFFNSPDQVNDFIYANVQSVYNAHILEQYYYQKLMFTAAVMYGQVKYEVGGNAKDLVKTITNVIGGMSTGSRNYARNRVTATDPKNAVIVISKQTLADMVIDFQASLFNPEVVTELFSGARRVPIDAFPSVWLYEKDHVVTQEDIANGFVGSARPDSKGIQVGDILPAGTLAHPGAPDAGVENPEAPGTRMANFDGGLIQAYVCDINHVIYLEDLPITITTNVNPVSRQVNIFGHSKLSLAINTNMNGIAILVATPEITEEQLKSLQAVDSGLDTGRPRKTAKTASPVVKAAAPKSKEDTGK